MADRTATGRLRRLLALVPYVLAHQGAPLAEVARRFDISERELMDDLDLLFVCGLPGYSHLELIDVSYESGDIYIRNADVISAPMRLHRDEALTLVIGLQLLEQIAASDQRQMISDLRAKIMAAASEAVEETSARIAIVPEVEVTVGSTVAEALQRNRRLLLDYFVASRDELTSREVDPIGIATIDGHRYLRAWCRTAEALRHFRLDRIESAKIVDRPAAPPDSDIADSAFVAPEGAPTARLKVRPGARWLIDFLGAEILEEHTDTTTIEVTVGDPERIVALVRQAADAVEVLQPDSLRAAVAASAAASLALYT